MRYILYLEFNTSNGEQYIPNGPIETIIIDYLGADVTKRNIAEFAKKIAGAYKEDQEQGNTNVDWSQYQKMFEEFLNYSEKLYNGFKMPIVQR